MALVAPDTYSRVQCSPGETCVPFSALHVRYRAPPEPEQRLTLYDLRPEVTVGQLRCGTEYAVSLAVENALGVGPPSDTIHISTQGSSKCRLQTDWDEKVD